MPPVKNKRKLRKSGEKLSPKDKKAKNICHPGQMAEVRANLDDDIQPTEIPNKNEWDKLMKKINDISKRTEDIQDIKKDVAEVKSNILGFQTRLVAIESQLKDQVQKTDKLEKKVKELEETHDLIGLLENELKATECENSRLKDQLLIQETYSRKNNLIFNGITEQKGESTPQVLKNFLSAVLKLSPQ